MPLGGFVHIASQVYRSWSPVFRAVEDDVETGENTRVTQTDVLVDRPPVGSPVCPPRPTLCSQRFAFRGHDDLLTEGELVPQYFDSRSSKYL